MLIEVNKVVSFHYKLTDSEQAILEDSNQGNPMVYLHGHKGMLPGVEEAMEGKKAGDKFSVTLEPEKAYGEVRENAVQRVSVKHVINPGKKKVKYKTGMMIQLNTQEGPRDVVVVKAGLKTLDVDTNHPFAGKTLVFDLEIVDVRDASAEEIAHGHVHGEGGHQH